MQLFFVAEYNKTIIFLCRAVIERSVCVRTVGTSSEGKPDYFAAGRAKEYRNGHVCEIDNRDSSTNPVRRRRKRGHSYAFFLGFLCPGLPHLHTTGPTIDLNS